MSNECHVAIEKLSKLNNELKHYIWKNKYICILNKIIKTLYKNLYIYIYKYNIENLYLHYFNKLKRLYIFSAL